MSGLVAEFDLGPGLRLEERIDAAEGEGIEGRWEFGKWMLSHVPKNGKKLPDGFLEQLTEATGKSRRELEYRRQFAEKFPTGITQHVAEWGSWHEIVNDVLPEKEKGAHVANNAGDNEWYTPPEFIAAAKATMGAIDLDPASSAEANEAIGAKRIYTAQDESLARQWKGRVWMNPPYARPLVDQFCEKLAEEAAAERVSEACVLVNNATETSWFQCLTDVTAAVFFPAKRVKFWKSDGTESAPLQGQAVLYLGANVEAFRHEFGKRVNGWSAVL